MFTIVSSGSGDEEAFYDKLDGGSEILRAIRRDDQEGLESIISRRPEEREARGHMGRRPLHAAAERGNIEMVRLLLAVGADVNGRRDREDTPLFWAPSAAIADCLLEAGADLHAKDWSGREPVHWAAQHGRPDVLELLISRGCAVDTGCKHKHTPLHWAAGGPGFLHLCRYPPPEMLTCVQLLLERGANVNAIGLDSTTPLHCGAVMPDMTVRNIDGEPRFSSRTPETVVSIVRVLLQHGADPEAVNVDGQRPIDLATNETLKEMELAIRQRQQR